MKKIITIAILFTAIHSTYGASVDVNVTRVQSPSSYTAPSGYEDKGFVGSIISQIFDPVGQILSRYVLAFQNILGVDNTVPVWNATAGVFDVGTITDTGTNVGIGVASPSERLEVNGAIRQEGSRPILYLTDTDTGADGFISANNNFGSVGIIADANSEVSGSFITMNIDGASRMRILENGSVGIGTTNPTSRLTIDGGGDIFSAAGESASLLLQSGNSRLLVDGNEMQASLNNVASDFAMQPFGGSIGIGKFPNTNRGTILDVNGLTRTVGIDVGNGAITGLDSAGGGIRGSNFDIDGVNGIRIHDPGEGINFHGGASIYVVDDTTDDKLQIDASGVGISTTNPSQKLDVNGKIRMRNQTQSTDAYDTVATKGYVDTIQDSIPTCDSTGTALGWDGNSWTCNIISGGSTGNTDDLVFETHQIDDCTSAGGTVYDTGSVKICKFSGNVCPNNWTRYQQWGSTSRNTCNRTIGGTCTTGSHTFGNQSTETCTYGDTSVCFAGTTEVGCY